MLIRPNIGWEAPEDTANQSEHRVLLGGFVDSGAVTVMPAGNKRSFDASFSMIVIEENQTTSGGFCGDACAGGQTVMRRTRIELAIVLMVEFVVVQIPPITPARFPPVIFTKAPNPVVTWKRNTWVQAITASSIGGSEGVRLAIALPFPRLLEAFSTSIEASLPELIKATCLLSDFCSAGF